MNLHTKRISFLYFIFNKLDFFLERRHVDEKETEAVDSVCLVHGVVEQPGLCCDNRGQLGISSCCLNTHMAPDKREEERSTWDSNLQLMIIPLFNAALIPPALLRVLAWTTNNHRRKILYNMFSGTTAEDTMTWWTITGIICFSFHQVPTTESKTHRTNK